MKRIVLAVCLCAMMFVAVPAWSYSVGLTDVGNVDTLLTAGSPNSGDQNEINWVNGFLGTSFTTGDLTKYSVMDWQQTNASGIWAIDFQTSDPAYFFIKTGNIAGGPPSGPDHFLYENIASLAWGVVDLAALGIDVVNITKISHVGELGGTPQVPEPTTMLLLGLGLVGLAGVSRKFKK